MQIEDLEDKAKIAEASGQEERAKQFQSRADELRAGVGALKSAERFPTKEINEQIGHVTLQPEIAGPLRLSAPLR